MTKKKKPAKQPKKSAAKLGNRYAAKADPSAVRRNMVYARVTDAEKNQMDQDAESRGETRSEYVRESILKRMREGGGK